MKYTILCPKFAQSQGKYGQLYASRVKVLIQQQGFSLPKGSPLQANVISRLMKIHLVFVSYTQYGLMRNIIIQTFEVFLINQWKMTCLEWPSCLVTGQMVASTFFYHADFYTFTNFSERIQHGNCLDDKHWNLPEDGERRHHINGFEGILWAGLLGSGRAASHHIPQHEPSLGCIPHYCGLQFHLDYNLLWRIVSCWQEEEGGW